MVRTSVVARVGGMLVLGVIRLGSFCSGWDYLARVTRLFLCGVCVMVLCGFHFAVHESAMKWSDRCRRAAPKETLKKMSDVRETSKNRSCGSGKRGYIINNIITTAPLVHS